MTATAGLRPSITSQRQRRVSVVGAATAYAALVVGAAANLSSAFALTDHRDSWWRFLAIGMALSVAGAVGRKYFTLPVRYLNTQGWTLATTALIAVVLFGVAVYEVVGVLDHGTGRIFFESTSGFTTVGMTAFDDVERLGNGVLFFRAATNWIGGLLAISMAAALLPSRVKTNDLISQQQRARGSRRSLAPTVRRGIRNITKFYAGATLVLVAAFFVAGMPWFDAIAHGLSTISTGGFSTRSQSLASFESAAIEWVAIGGMLLAGTSVAILWASWRSRGRVAWRSTELRWFVASVCAGTGLIWWLERGVDGHIPVRTALVAAMSFASTTGLQSFAWDAWTGGSQTILLLLMAAGAMSGSAGGGFGVIRVIALVAYAKRELLRLLYPSMVAAIKVDGQAIPESTLRHTLSHLVLFAGLVLGGAYGVALFEPDLRQSLLTAISGATTTGLLPDVRNAAELERGTRVVLVAVMVMGRLGITPLAVTLDVLVSKPRDRAFGAVRGMTGR